MTNQDLLLVLSPFILIGAVFIWRRIKRAELNNANNAARAAGAVAGASVKKAKGIADSFKDGFKS